MEEYGARIVKPIKMFVEKEGLEDELVERKRHLAKSAKENTRSKTLSEQIIEIPDDDDDEFDDGIDYSAIDLGY